MYNKKGFTLVELLAVIVILGIIVLIAVPNVVKLVDDSKKNQVLSDAKKLLANVKSKENLVKYEPLYVNISSTGVCMNDNIIFQGDIENDPDGNEYDKSISCVKKNSQGKYEIKFGSKRENEWKWIIVNSNTDSIPDFVSEDSLSIDKIVKK